MRFMLRNLRERRGLSPRQMYERLGVKEDRYRKWETGVNGMPLDYAIAACSILRCSLDELAGLVVPAPSSDEERLLELYRSCNGKGREYLLQVAEVTAGLFAG